MLEPDRRADVTMASAICRARTATTAVDMYGSFRLSAEECGLKQRCDVAAGLRSRPSLIHHEVVPYPLGRHRPEATGGRGDVPARYQLAFVVKGAARPARIAVGERQGMANGLRQHQR